MNKEEQKRLIIEIMNEDAKDGLYEPAQTATEWLFVQLYERFEMKGDGREMDKVLERAKVIEKKHLVKLLQWMNKIASETPMRLETDLDDIVEQYYNETYGKDSN